MFYLALRQILSRKRQNFLILLGIGFGTMIYIVVAGLQLGMREYFISQLLNNTAHILVSGEERYVEEDLVTNLFYPDSLVHWMQPPRGKREEGRLDNPQGWFDFLEGHPLVLAYSPRYSLQGLVRHGKFKASMSLTGIIPAKHVKVTALEDYMKVGSLHDLKAGGNTIILASELMKELGVSVGNTVMVTPGAGESFPFKIVGEIHLGNKALDEVFALAHLRDVQKIDHNPGRIHDIAISLVHMDYALPLAEKWSQLARDKVQSWQQANKQFMEMIFVQDLFRYIITATVLLVSGFGIYNVLSIMISQKQKEIAILKSMGFGSAKILELFFIQGLFFGVAGGFVGVTLGYALCRFIGQINFSIDIGGSNHLWISYDPLLYGIGYVAAIGSSVIAGLLPSYHASKLTPMEIIRQQS